MDVCCANYKSASESVSGFCEILKETPDCAFSKTEGFLVNDLGNHFTEYLKIQDCEDSTDKYHSKTLKGDINKDTHGSDSGKAASGKCLIKWATFPCSGISMPSEDLVDGEEWEDDLTADVVAYNAESQSTDSPYSRCTSLPGYKYEDGSNTGVCKYPISLKLASAVKGSREKQGRLPSKKLTVTWAPDVYEPPPTAVSHVPNKGQRQKNEKKNGKNKQKSNGKSSRGSNGKDKKQGRKKWDES